LDVSIKVQPNGILDTKERYVRSGPSQSIERYFPVYLDIVRENSYDASKKNVIYYVDYQTNPKSIYGNFFYYDYLAYIFDVKNEMSIDYSTYGNFLRDEKKLYWFLSLLGKYSIQKISLQIDLPTEFREGNIYSIKVTNSETNLPVKVEKRGTQFI
jgi:hypothetical protein